MYQADYALSDYADRIAEKVAFSGDVTPDQWAYAHFMNLLAEAAREGYNLGYGAASA